MTFLHTLWLDYETRSRVNLKTHGAYRYTQCPDHRILVVGYALDDAPPKAAIITPDGRGWPTDLRAMLRDKRVQIRAHNAAFDRLQMGKDAPPIDRWYCTAAQARGAALPGKLEDLGRAVGANLRKDPRGAELIQLLSVPQADGGFCNDPKLLREFADYCASDIATMRACSQALPEMRDIDLRVYHASERINDRGMPIDVELCTLATQYAEQEAQDAAGAVIKLSKGALRSVKGTKLRDWVYERLDPTLRKHMELWKDGKQKTSLAADIRATLLDIAEENPDAFSPDVVDMIEAAEAGSMSSVAKFQTMLNRVSDDDRLRGAFVFNGAYQTNRWSATGAQVHNFPRLTAKDPEAVLAKMRRGEPLAQPLLTLKSMLRPAIKPKGRRVIVRADWNAIEARGLPWLVDTPAAMAYMAAFTDDSRDVYVEQSHAAGLGGERQPGKVVVLSLGYGGGEGALSKMAKNYGVVIDDKGGVVVRWRKANGWVADKRTGWWASLMRCAHNAFNSPGRSFAAGRVVFAMQGANLTMTLPSGRVMHYPLVTSNDGPYGPELSYLKASWKPKADAKEWPKGRAWHGIFAENADQAMCADLLRETLLRLDCTDMNVIGHVHDEIITEEEAGDRAVAKGKALQAGMLVMPAWAKGLPLKAEVDISPRFRK